MPAAHSLGASSIQDHAGAFVIFALNFLGAFKPPFTIGGNHVIQEGDCAGSKPASSTASASYAADPAGCGLLFCFAYCFLFLFFLSVNSTSSSASSSSTSSSATFALLANELLPFPDFLPLPPLFLYGRKKRCALDPFSSFRLAWLSFSLGLAPLLAWTCLEGNFIQKHCSSSYTRRGPHARPGRLRKPSSPAYSSCTQWPSC